MELYAFIIRVLPYKTYLSPSRNRGVFVLFSSQPLVDNSFLTLHCNRWRVLLYIYDACSTKIF